MKGEKRKKIKRKRKKGKKIKITSALNSAGYKLAIISQTKPFLSLLSQTPAPF